MQQSQKHQSPQRSAYRTLNCQISQIRAYRTISATALQHIITAQRKAAHTQPLYRLPRAHIGYMQQSEKQQTIRQAKLQRKALISLTPIRSRLIPLLPLLLVSTNRTMVRIKACSLLQQQLRAALYSTA